MKYRVIWERKRNRYIDREREAETYRENKRNGDRETRRKVCMYVCERK